MTPRTLFQEAIARSSAIEQYAKRHDELAEAEHIALLEGRDADAGLFRRLGRIALRAWLAEMSSRITGR